MRRATAGSVGERRIGSGGVERRREEKRGQVGGGRREREERRGVLRGVCEGVRGGWEGEERIGRVVCCGLLRLGRDSSTPTIAG